MSDGHVGIENQVLGLAEAFGRLTAATVEIKRVRWPFGIGRLPTSLIPPLPALVGLQPPWPDLWIAAGRATLPLSLAVRRLSGGRTFVVQAQDPRIAPDRFDLVIPPNHDGLTGPNVLPITGSPNRVTPQRLAEAQAAFADRLAPLPHPRVAVLIGGRSRAHDLPAARAESLAGEIAGAVRDAGGSVMLTTSRRTPPAASAVLRARLANLPGWLWDGAGPNPYFAFLAAADAVIVTADSTNMAVEAATAGKPVLVAPLPGGAPKFDRLHAELQALGAARPFTGSIESWSYTPPRDTDRAAAEIVRRMAERGVRSPAPAR